MKQKVISTMLLLSMGATLLAGCGSTAGNGKEGGAGASNAEEGRDTTHYLLTLIHSVYMETQSTTHGYSLEQMRL